jgi:hypothetical protein
MKTVAFLAALLFASGSKLDALDVGTPVHHWWELDPRVLESKRVMATIVAVPSSTQIIIHLDRQMGAFDKGELLLTTYEPIRQHFTYAQVVGFEASTLLYIGGHKGVAFVLVPLVGYQWQIGIKSAHLCATLSI